MKGLKILPEGAADVHRILLEHAPKGKAGRHLNNGCVDAAIIDRKRKPNTRTVLEIRLAQETPKFYEAYIAGQYKTITAAAVAAKLIKGGNNLRRAQSAYRKMTPLERRQFHTWLKANKR